MPANVQVLKCLKKKKKKRAGVKESHDYMLYELSHKAFYALKKTALLIRQCQLM